MKKALLCIVVFLFAISLYAQQEPIVKFYLNDGSAKEYKIEDVESIGIIPGSSNYLMALFYNDNFKAYFPTDSIKSMTFDLDSIGYQRLNINIFNETKSYLLKNVDSICFSFIEILKIIPTSAVIGDEVTISGRGFANIQDTNFVNFNDIKAKDYSDWCDTAIKVTVPNGASSGKVTVSIYGQKSNEVDFFIIPHIEFISPPTAKIGDTITIIGSGFCSNQDTSFVSFGNIIALKYINWSDTEIKVVIPEGVTSWLVSVTVNEMKSNEVDFTIATQITRIVPKSSVIGDLVTIVGYGFGASQGTSFVYFNSIKPSKEDYQSWTSTEIKVKVPQGAFSGKVSVTVGSQKSNEVDFTVIPHITNITPTSAVIGDEITINGSGFCSSRGSSVVTFSSINVSEYTSWSETQIKVKVPPGACANKVSVTVGSQKSNELDFTVIPHITNITPTSAVIGDEITINGTGFCSSRGTSIVSFGSINVIDYTSWNDTQIKVKVPPGVCANKVTVTVGSQKSNEIDFTVIPHITNITPTSAIIGDEITINGTGFCSSRGASVVSFGSINVSEYTSWSETQIKVKVPPGVCANKVTVTVGSQKSNEIDFTVIPHITNITPTSAVIGDEITINGTGFCTSRGTSIVQFNSINVTEYTSWSETQIKVKVPPGVCANKVSVTVGSQKSNEVDFTVIPHITNITPTSAIIGDEITINGTGFCSSLGTSIVSFGSINVIDYTSWNDTQIKVKVPPGVCANKVTVTVGSQKSNEVDFTVIPRITNITPTSAVIGDEITINGTGFCTSRGTSIVSFGSINVIDYTSWNDTQIKVKVPPGVCANKVTVTVGSQKSNEIDFTVIPHLTNITPTSAVIGDEITINGTGFCTSRGTSIVSFGSINVIDYTSWNDTQIKVKVPQGAATGKLSVTVGGIKSNEVDVTITFQSVTIGSQIWMLKNLNVDHYRNGDSIPEIRDPTEWANTMSGAWCYNNNDPANGAIYGKLYNWFAVNDPRGLAPSGWHVPSNEEWITLINYLGGVSIAGGKMKESGTSHWQSPNTGATNVSGFSALPGGWRSFIDGKFSFLSLYGFWWSSTDRGSGGAFFRFLEYDFEHINDSTNANNYKYGFSVRCIKDQ